MMALYLKRLQSNTSTPNNIIKSLKEKSFNNEELGMYWTQPSGYWWHQAPIETHSLMIEVFDEVARDMKAVDDLKTWLLKNKQTNCQRKRNSFCTDLLSFFVTSFFTLF